MEALLPHSSISLLEDKLYQVDRCVQAIFLILAKVDHLLLVIMDFKSKGTNGSGSGGGAGEAALEAKIGISVL